MAHARVGVIDIGSNSTLLVVGARTGAGWQVLTDQTRITRLGEGFSDAKHLQPDATMRTLQAIAAYLAECHALGATAVIGLATAAVREACNPERLLNPLREQFGFQQVDGFHEVVAHLQRGDVPARLVCVLSEAEEATLSFRSVAQDAELGLGDATVAVVDIGGGSVEVAYGHTEPTQWLSLPVGARRMRETYMPSDPPEPREVLRATRALDEAFEPLRSLPQPERVVAVGGTGVNLAILALELPTFDPTRVHATWLTDEAISALLYRLLRLSDAERRTLPGIEPDRAPLLHIGALILERALFALRREAVQVSIRGIRYGALWSL